MNKFIRSDVNANMRWSCFVCSLEDYKISFSQIFFCTLLPLVAWTFALLPICFPVAFRNTNDVKPEQSLFPNQVTMLQIHSLLSYVFLAFDITLSACLVSTFFCLNPVPFPMIAYPVRFPNLLHWAFVFMSKSKWYTPFTILLRHHDH